MARHPCAHALAQQDSSVHGCGRVDAFSGLQAADAVWVCGVCVGGSQRMTTPALCVCLVQAGVRHVCARALWQGQAAVHAQVCLGDRVEGDREPTRPAGVHCGGRREIREQRCGAEHFCVVRGCVLACLVTSAVTDGLLTVSSLRLCATLASAALRACTQPHHISTATAFTGSARAPAVDDTSAMFTSSATAGSASAAPPTPLALCPRLLLLLPHYR